MLNLVKKIDNKFKIKRRVIAGLASVHAFGHPSKKMKVVGVTGTNGKTTVATLLYKIAIELGYKAGLIGTVEVLINGKYYEFDHKIPTTPDPITLNQILKAMKKEKVEYVFMEVSSHAMDQARVAGINFVGGIFTNLTHDHLDYHKSIENYFGAKKKFFKMLSTNAFALSNIDDAYGERMLEGIRARKYTYGFSHKSDFGERLETKLLGEFNAYNAIAVFGTCKLLGFDEVKVKEILKNVTPPAGRFESFNSDSGILCIVDYAHTPDALENVLKTARGILKKGVGHLAEVSNTLISVFGCGGDRDPAKRSMMGKIGATMSDIAIFTSDNPRNEDPDKIIEQMKLDLSENELNKIKTIPDRREAIMEAVNLAKAGDIILVAGKGHEHYQEIHGVKHHFNDMEEVKKLLG